MVRPTAWKRDLILNSLGLALAVGPIVEIADKLGWIDPYSVLSASGLHFAEYGFFSPQWLNGPIGLVLCVLIGVLILTATLHLARFIVRGHALVAKSMLVLP